MSFTSDTAVPSIEDSQEPKQGLWLEPQGFSSISTVPGSLKLGLKWQTSLANLAGSRLGFTNTASYAESSGS